MRLTKSGANATHHLQNLITSHLRALGALPKNRTRMKKCSYLVRKFFGCLRAEFPMSLLLYMPGNSLKQCLYLRQMLVAAFLQVDKYCSDSDQWKHWGCSPWCVSSEEKSRFDFTIKLLILTNDGQRTEVWRATDYASSWRSLTLHIAYL